MAKLNGTEWDEGEWQRQHSAEVARLREMVDSADHNERVALADLDELSANVARLREALEGLKHCDGCYCEAAFSMLDGSHPRHSVECKAACDALDSSSGHWLRQHDAQVREGERERCAARCDELAARWNSYDHIGTDMGNWYFAGKAVGGELCAIAVRDQEADDD